MTNEQIQERKSYLIQTIDARDVLTRYGVKISRSRCKGFCHNVNEIRLHSSDEDGFGGGLWFSSIDCPNCNNRIIREK